LREPLAFLGLQTVEGPHEGGVSLGGPAVPEGPGDSGEGPSTVPQRQSLRVAVLSSAPVDRTPGASAVSVLVSPVAPAVVPRQVGPTWPGGPLSPARSRS
jgi:hypothetical protein